MQDSPFFYRSLLGAGVIGAILLVGAAYWMPSLQLPSAQKVAALLMQPLTVAPPAVEVPAGSPTLVQPQARVAIKTEVAKPQVAVAPPPAAEPDEGTAAAQSAGAVPSTPSVEAEVATSANDADKEVVDAIHKGNGKEGLGLADIDMAGRQDSDSIEDWLAAGLVVLEVQTTGRTYVAQANNGASSDMFASLRLTPIANVGNDPRSELRVVYREGASPIRVELLELRMTQLGISDARIDRVDVVFTNAALSLFKQTQDAMLDALVQQGRDLHPEELRLAVCFTATHQVGVKAVTEVTTGDVLLLPGTCP